MSSKRPVATAGKLMKYWLSGTTCSRYKHSVHFVSDDGRFVLLKHHGHSEYINAWYPAVYCETYYQLFDLRTVDIRRVTVNPAPQAIETFRGRWSKDKQRQVEEHIRSIRDGRRKKSD